MEVMNAKPTNKYWMNTTDLIPLLLTDSLVVCKRLLWHVANVVMILWLTTPSWLWVFPLNHPLKIACQVSWKKNPFPLRISINVRNVANTQLLQSKMCYASYLAYLCFIWKGSLFLQWGKLKANASIILISICQSKLTLILISNIVFVLKLRRALSTNYLLWLCT